FTSAPASAGSDPFIGTIQSFGLNFCPRDWAPADGRLLQIAQYTALFSLLGTMYGGDGRTTFGLPNLNGRAGMGFGTGPGLTTRQMGQVGGTETNTMNSTTMASHTHGVVGTITGNTVASAAAPTTTDPANGYYATFPGGASVYADPSTPPVEMGDGSVEFSSSAAIVSSGGGQPTQNRQPYLAVTHCVALQGIYPSRS
ncbi:MAG: tail fiber protein, partial [Pseudomonadota bacterium]